MQQAANWHRTEQALSPLGLKLAIHEEADRRTAAVIRRLFSFDEGTGFYAGLIIRAEDVDDRRLVLLTAERSAYQRARREARSAIYNRLCAKIAARFEAAASRERVKVAA